MYQTCPQVFTIVVPLDAEDHADEFINNKIREHLHQIPNLRLDPFPCIKSTGGGVYELHYWTTTEKSE